MTKFPLATIVPIKRTTAPGVVDVELRPEAGASDSFSGQRDFDAMMQPRESPDVKSTRMTHRGLSAECGGLGGHDGANTGT